MQKITSAGTSLNQVPSLIKLIEKENGFRDDMVVLDYGAGRYHKAQEYVQGTHRVTYLTYDPYNRSEEDNFVAMSLKADIVILSNVLNVVKEPEDRLEILKQIKNQMKPGARLYIRTYNAPRSNLYQEDPYPGQPTKRGTCWQNCQPLTFYMDEIKQVLDLERGTSEYLVAKLKE